MKLVFNKRMILIFVSQLFVFSLAFSRQADPGLPHDDLRVVLVQVGRQINSRQQDRITSVLLYGRSLSFMTLVVNKPPSQVMQDLHRLSLFERFTRVGRRVIYEGRKDEFQMQLVLELGNAQETRALLSAVRSREWEPGASSLSRGVDGLQAGRDQDIPMPDGGQLLNDTCFLEPRPICHQVYLFSDPDPDRIHAQFRQGLEARKWRQHGKYLGLSTWRNGRKMIQFMLLSVEGQTSLFLASSDFDGKE